MCFFCCRLNNLRRKKLTVGINVTFCHVWQTTPFQKIPLTMLCYLPFCKGWSLCGVLLQRWQNPFQLERLVSLPHYFIRALDTKWQILVCIFACLHSFRKHIDLFLASFSVRHFSFLRIFFQVPSSYIHRKISTFILEGV